MTPQDAPPGQAPHDLLRSGEAGARVIRGGVVRAGGYAIGVGLSVVTSALLLRHLGVVDFGHYVSVTALLGIVAMMTDAGLTAIGARELAVLEPGPERDRLLSSLLALRLLTTSVGVLVAVAFAAVAYDSERVIGAALVGASVVLISLQGLSMLPLYVALRMPTITALEVTRHAATLLGVAALVVAGAGLIPLFAVQIGVGALLLAVTAVIVRRIARLAPSFDFARLRRLVRETLTLSIAVTMTALYFGALVVLVSLVGTKVDTGLFGTSARIMEVLVGLPAMVLGVVLPVFSVAGREDLDRLRYGVQRVSEVGMLIAALFVVLIVILAERAIVLIGGSAYADAASVLQIQAFAIVGVFLTQTMQLALLALKRQRAMVMTNSAGLLLVVALGLVLVPRYGARGAAVAAVVAEAALALVLVAVLWKAERSVAPDFRFLWKVAAAAGCACLALVPNALSAWLQAAIAGTLYIAVAFAVKAVPPEALHALAAPLRRHRASDP